MAIADPNFPVQPADIDTDSLAIGRFGKFESEFAAKCIVIICKRKGSWQPFTAQEFATVCQELKPEATEHEIWMYLQYAIDPTSFSNLFPRSPQPREDLIVQREDQYFVTEDFVERCQIPHVTKNFQIDFPLNLPYIDDGDDDN